MAITEEEMRKIISNFTVAPAQPPQTFSHGLVVSNQGFTPAPLPPPAWPDNTLIRDLLVRMDKELAEALKALLKRLDKIDEVVGRIEQAGRYSS